MLKVPRNELDIEKVKTNFILKDGKLIRIVNCFNKPVYEIISTTIKNNRYFKVALHFRPVCVIRSNYASKKNRR